MLSEHKLVLHLAEFVCAGAALVCLVAALFARLMPARAAWVEGLVYLAFAAVFCLGLLAALLLNEFSRELAYRRGSPAGDGAFMGRLFGFVRRYAPGAYKQMSAFGGLLVLLVPLVLGPLSWSSGEAVSPYQGMGFMLALGGAFLVLLSAFAAAARMPGAFEDHESLFGDA